MADLRSHSAWRRRGRAWGRPRVLGRGEAGFTLIEISITIAVLLVGVLGTVALIDGASATTASNRAREGATALARELVEVSRAVPYAQLTPSEIEGELQARPALADSGAGPGYTLHRRGFTYAVSIGACSVDDAKDGLGAHGGAVTYCPESTATGTHDRNPDDYRRVTIALTWRRDGREETARQTTLVTNPAGGLGPSVKDLQPVAPASGEILDPAVTTASFDVRTSSTPASVEWYLNGAPRGLAGGSGTDWTFTWPLPSTFLDGTYLLQARAFNEEGRSGVARVVTVVVNRFRPLPPSGVGAGRNGNGSHVDVEWHANAEGDVIGYRVWRTDAGGTPVERACPPAGSSQSFLQGQLSCVDEAAPADGPLHYAVVALDRDADGTVREGTATPVAVVEGNTAPDPPAGLTLCAGGSDGCNDPDGQPAPPGTTVLSWQPATDPDGDAVRFYRIYRDGTGYGARRDRLYASAVSLIWIDDDTDGAVHDYRVSAVDGDFAESDLAGPVSG